MTDTKDLEAKLAEQKAAAKARQDVEAERLRVAALEAESEQLTWDEAAATMCGEAASLGTQGVDWQIARLRDCMAVFTKPSRSAWENHQDAHKGDGTCTCDEHQKFARACLWKKTTKVELSAMFDRMPQFLATCLAVCTVLGAGGSRTWEGK